MAVFSSLKRVKSLRKSRIPSIPAQMTYVVVCDTNGKLGTRFRLRKKKTVEKWVPDAINIMATFMLDEDRKKVYYKEDRRDEPANAFQIFAVSRKLG